MKVEVIQDLLEHITIPGARVLIVVRDSHYARYIANRLRLRKHDWRNADGTIQVVVVQSKQDVYHLAGLTSTRIYMVDNSNPFIDTDIVYIHGFLRSRMRSTVYSGPFELVKFQLSYQD